MKQSFLIRTLALKFLSDFIQLLLFHLASQEEHYNCTIH